MRKALGWSQATLAKRSGTSELTVLRFELHGTKAYGDTIKSWADAIGCTADELLTDSGFDTGEHTGHAN